MLSFSSSHKFLVSCLNVTVTFLLFFLSATTFIDESGSDSEGAADSGDSTSSYSSLSDFVSELASSDLSASRGIAIAARRKSHQKHQPTTAEEEYEVEEDYPSQPQRHEVFSRNITQLCSSLDLSTVYNPPSSLLLPGVQDPSQARKASISGLEQH